MYNYVDRIRENRQMKYYDFDINTGKIKTSEMFVLNQKNTDLAFNNAFNKDIFTKIRANEMDYIMYMCSDSDFDYFKSKLTKTRWKVERKEMGK